MKLKIIFLFFLFLFSIQGISQEIKLKSGIASVNGQIFVGYEKINKMAFLISNPYSNEKILRINLKKAFNSIDGKIHKLPTVHFIRLDKTMSFEINIKSKKKLIEFLYSRNMVLPNGKANENIVIDYYKSLENRHHTRKKN